MKDYILENGLKLVYKKGNSELTSIAISLDAGAARDGDKLGVAHVTEHMVYKQTETRDEKEINTILSDTFGFQNAMTNYPYVVFYGTLLNEDIDKGLEIFSDILLNPVFTEAGFAEEMEVIKQELKEWDEELEQYTEDKLYLNSMDRRRIKYPIIGTKESLKDLTIDDAIDFFNDYYCANNGTITVITSLEFEQVVDKVEEYFLDWRSESLPEDEVEYTNPITGVFKDNKEEINTAKVQIIFPIHTLNQWEIKALKVFNQYFGEGVNSMLFETLRTKNSLVYDVLTKVSNEEHINIYKITYSIAVENVDKSIKVVQSLINDVDKFKKDLNTENISKIIKSFKLKRLFAEEQTVRLAKELSTYDTMFGDYNIYLDEIDGLEKLTPEYIINTVVKVFNNMSIQVITK